MLTDPTVYRYCGLRTYHYQSQLPGGADTRPIGHRSFEEAFPEATIVTPLYIDYANFAAIPKAGDHAAFFVLRDPRDVVVSWYFSARYSHPLMGDLATARAFLGSLPVPDGLSYSMNYLNEFGLFDAMRSWWLASESDPSAKVVKFEDLIGPRQEEIFSDVFSWCDIPIPRPQLRRLLARYDFKRLSGREPGKEDHFAHYRKGVAGDWRVHLDDHVQAELRAMTNNLAEDLGYEAQ